MVFESKTKFFENYEFRYSVLLGYQLLFLMIYRLLTLFKSTEGLHHIPFITPTQLQLIFLFVELGFCFLFLIQFPRILQDKNIFFFTLLIIMFFEVLYVEQYFISTDPILLNVDDLVLVLLQVLIILVLFVKNFSLKRFHFEEIDSNLPIYLLISFVLLLLFSLQIISSDLSLLILFLADFCFWIFLSLLIIKYAKVLAQRRLINAIIPLAIGFLFGFGMFMGMTMNQVMTAVIITIIDQTFSLHAIEPLIFGLNVKFLMIFIDVVIGIMFIIVMFVEL